MPVYLVKTPQGDKLIDANTKSQAINHVVKNTVTADVMTASETVRLMQNGVAVEKAGVDIPTPEKAIIDIV